MAHTNFVKLQANSKPPTNKQLHAWLRLIRAPAIPSSAANVLAGFLIANTNWLPIWDLLLLVISSCCLYASGMVLNDISDIQEDRIHTPQRPIAAGEISIRHAWFAFLALTASGLVASALASFSSLLVAVSIVVAIFLYSRPLKKTTFASIMMGTCRFLNVALGGSTSASIAAGGVFWGVPILLLWIATSLAITVAGITLFAKNENIPIGRNHLYFSLLVLATGFLGYLLAPLAIRKSQWNSLVFTGYLIVVTLIAIRPFNLSILGIRQLDGNAVRRAVIAFLQSLIFLDAAVCFLAANQFVYPIAVLLLLIPTKMLARSISAT